ncbi:glycosyltransferase family 9 protein [Calditrichota bacterium LG25]
MESVKRVLIIRFSSIGDILLTTPFIRQTRIAFYNAKIDFIVKKNFFELIQYNPHLNTIFTFDDQAGLKGLLALRKRIKARNYDYILDLHNNIRSRILTFSLPAKIYRMKKNKFKRALLVYFKINLFREIIPVPEKYLKVGRPLGIQDDSQGLELFWKDRNVKTLRFKLKNDFLRGKMIAIAPGAGFKTKQWPIEYFRKLIQLIEDEGHYKIILLGNAVEAESFRPLVTSERVLNLAGKLSLLETAYVLNRAKFVVSNDSGVMHMATAVRTPVLAIFGSTVKEFGFFPYRAKSMVVENNNLWCRPCSHVGRKRCPLFHFKCMKSIPPQMVFNQLKNWM